MKIELGMMGDVTHSMKAAIREIQQISAFLESRPEWSVDELLKLERRCRRRREPFVANLCLRRIGMHFYFEETWGVAAKYFRRLLRREENDSIRFFAGECEERLGHLAVARREYERVARSDRDSSARKSAVKALARLAGATPRLR